MELVKVASGRRIVLPKSLDIKEGDILELEEKEGEIVLKPVAVIPKSQQWFWQKEWLGKEKEASKDLKEGRYKDFKKVGDLLKDLKD
ncbi:MAG: AbrB/MazE/SpoVT family DNA-binding domain-containing protein [Nitrospinae bacterium]|nr:AbrB/MazE/SpoVT family DNA-binding domain-containing protein [Nitrospinota bacterium]